MGHSWRVWMDIGRCTRTYKRLDMSLLPVSQLL